MSSPKPYRSRRLQAAVKGADARYVLKHRDKRLDDWLEPIVRSDFSKHVVHLGTGTGGVRESQRQAAQHAAKITGK